MNQLWIKVLVVVHLLQFQSKEKKSSVIKKFRNAFRTFLWQMMSNEKLSVEKTSKKSLEGKPDVSISEKAQRQWYNLIPRYHDTVMPRNSYDPPHWSSVIPKYYGVMKLVYHATGIPWNRYTMIPVFMIPVYHDTVIQWCHDTMMPRYHYAVIQWNCDAVIPWYNYAIIPWCNGTMILWHHETMIPKRCDTIISLCYYYIMIISYGQHHIQW